MGNLRDRAVTTSCGQMMWRITHLSSAQESTMVVEVIAQRSPAIVSHVLPGKCKVSAKSIKGVIICLSSKLIMKEYLVFVFIVGALTKFYLTH